MRPHISVAVPVYSCAGCLPALYSRLRDTLEQITPHFEILLVNDCSPDNAWEVIRGLCEEDPRGKGINFSRNFGQQYAITAALDRVSGDWIVVMDCDLQDQP
jgi:dolichol-phosphate mannosyltransferase